MGTLFIILAVWCLLCLVLAEVVPLLLEFLWYGLCWLLECLGVALGYLLTLLARLVVWGARLGWRGLVMGGLFLGLLIQEWWRGPAYEDEEEDESADEDEEEDESPEASCAAARTLLGLKPDFTRAALNRAYKKAMKSAHPDAGGSTRKAQAVNAARELLMRTRGWA